MNIPNSAVRQILDNIPDRKQRDQMANILTGKIVKRVKCLGDKPWYSRDEKGELVKHKPCNGRVIANIYNDGKIRLAASEGKGWLRAFVHRLDGVTGFQCWCGNDSRLSKQEKAVVRRRGVVATKEYIEEVAQNVIKNPSNYPIKNGVQVVDGFAIEEIA